MMQPAMQTETRAPHLRVDYVDESDPARWLRQPDVLAVFGFAHGRCSFALKGRVRATGPIPALERRRPGAPIGTRAAGL